MSNGFGKLIAVAVLLGFVVLLVYLFGISSTADEQLWNRAIFLYGGAEAVAFAAAGFLFGREVHRERAEKAEQRADDQARAAASAQKEATDATARGQALRTAIAEKEALIGDAGGDFKALSVQDADAAQAATKKQMAELLSFAQKMFP